MFRKINWRKPKRNFKPTIPLLRKSCETYFMKFLVGRSLWTD